MTVAIHSEQRGLLERHVELAEALDASSTDECVECGLKLGGILGSFQWGGVHGHGRCSGCGFPYVYYHYQEVEPDKELLLCAWVPNATMPLAPEEPA